MGLGGRTGRLRSLPRGAHTRRGRQTTHGGQGVRRMDHSLGTSGDGGLSGGSTGVGKGAPRAPSGRHRERRGGVRGDRRGRTIPGQEVSTRRAAGMLPGHTRASGQGRPQAQAVVTRTHRSATAGRGDPPAEHAHTDRGRYGAGPAGSVERRMAHVERSATSAGLEAHKRTTRTTRTAARRRPHTPRGEAIDASRRRRSHDLRAASRGNAAHGARTGCTRPRNQPQPTTNGGGNGRRGARGRGSE